MLEPPGFLMLNYGVQTPREPRRPHCLRVASPRWATEILATAGCFTGTEVIACLATDMELVEDAVNGSPARWMQGDQSRSRLAIEGRRLTRVGAQP